MNVYDLIAEHYNELFPLESEKLDFIQRLCPPPARFCDAGCATGDLAVELSQRGYNVCGLDLNAKMIALAKENALRKNTRCELSFYQADIVDINRFGKYNGIFCFGNTLPHLKDDETIRHFFSSVYNSLKVNGIFIVEVLNYDKILYEKKMEFKEKETDNFIFKRHYDFLQDGNVKFTISLTDKLHDISSSDFTILHPLKRNTILSLFEQAGFQSVESYSDYRFTKSNAEDYAVVYVARLCV